MEDDNGKGKRISVEQRETMLDFMEKHPSLAMNKFTAPDGAKHKQRLLNELTNVLNSIANGVSKPADKWMKSWQDWRSDTKSKAAVMKKEIHKTGGGKINPKAKPLTPLEERLLSFLGPTVVSGHQEVMDPLLVDSAITNSASKTQTWDKAANDTIPIPPPFAPNVYSPGPSGSSEILITDDCCSSLPSTSESMWIPMCNGKTTGGKASKRKVSESSITEQTENEDLKLLKLSECQVNIAKTGIELQKEKIKLQHRRIEMQSQQIELQTRQTAALESAATAFVGAMRELELYYKRQRGENSVS